MGPSGALMDSSLARGACGSPERVKTGRIISYPTRNPYDEITSIDANRERASSQSTRLLGPSAEKSVEIPRGSWYNPDSSSTWED
jgi:hypothetical protein